MSFNAAGTAQRRVRDSLVLAIRNAFKSHTKYPYKETTDGEFDFDNSKVWVADVTPLESVTYPMITVDTLSGEDQRYLGDELTDRVDPSVGGLTISQTVNFTSIPMTATVKIYTRDTLVRDDLQSAVYDTLKINKDILATVGGAEVIGTRWAADAREYLYDRWWYVSAITMEIYAEWSTSYGISTISSVSLTNVFTESITSEF